MTAIDTEAVEAYKRWRREHGGRRGGKGPRILPRSRTVNIDLITLKKALKLAASMGIIEKPPSIVRIPEGRDKKKPKWLSVDEMEQVLAAASPARHLLLLFAFHTGLRPGEINSRYKSDIDLERGYVRVDDHQEIKFFVKRKRKRTVPLTECLRQALEAAWDDLPDEGPIFAGQSMKMTLRRICNKVGLPVLNPYGTRHTFASRWAYEGRSKDALIKIMGHADGRMIDEVYAHFGTAELADHMVRVGWGGESNVVPLRAGQASGKKQGS